MTVLLGDKDRFALEIGGWWSGRLRYVDVWVAGQWATCDDNVAYVPQFRYSLQRERARPPSPFPELAAEAVHRRFHADEDGLGEPWAFLQWGPTTDGVISYLLPDDDGLAVTLEFWRDDRVGTVFAARLAHDELPGILREAVAVLEAG